MKKKNYSVPFIGIINLSFDDVLTLSIENDENGMNDHDPLTKLFGNQS